MLPFTRDSVLRPVYTAVIQDLALLERLHEFQPMIIGTPPLEIATDASDIDLACYAPNLDRFRNVVNSEFHSEQEFRVRETNAQTHPALLASFRYSGWSVELFCQSIPTAQQWGVRHFLVERRLIALAPELKNTVRELKLSGWKTEPAFARALGLADADAYRAILQLESWDDHQLKQLCSRASDRRTMQREEPDS